ncbi:MAG TPA: adenylate/guanylate cyclase domain-containing protein [Dehalococcoidia bacterium]
MEPQIRYARRTDGARTAYAVVGSGPVMVYTPGFASHLEWNFGLHTGSSTFMDTLAARRTLIYYDRHGCGLSDRRRTDFTPEDDMLDLDAVIEASGAGQVDLFGISFGAMVAVRYAAEHPEHTRRLILWGALPGNDPSGFPPEVQERLSAVATLRRGDPELGTRIFASQAFPSGVDPETFQFMLRALKEGATPDMLEKLETVLFDNRGYFARVSVPTLVLHRRGDQVVPFAAGQYLARRLPNAQFVPLDGDCHIPNFGDVDSVLTPILKFLAEDDAQEHDASRSQETAQMSGTAIILFTDIADSTSLTERMGDAAFRTDSRALDTSIRAAIRDFGGTPVSGKVLGDGVMGVFTSATQAIQAARRCVEASGALPLHIGLHAGDVIREDDNVYGGAVNIASRICGLCEPGEILVSATIRELARTSAGVVFEDRGEQILRGIDDPVRVFAVRAGE